MTTLIISPHLDDAVWSLGGSIAAWTAAGTRVVVATVYTAGPPLDEVAPEMRVFADYATRRAEDLAACASVGAEVRWLDQVERAFRRPYTTGLAYFTTPVARDGFTALAAVTRALEPLGALEPTRILVPLGVGNHVDHVEAMVAATDWALAHGLGDRLAFYEDFYALDGTLRRRHAIARTRMWPSGAAPLRKARVLGTVMRAIASAQHGPDPTSFLAPALRGARWTATATEVTAHEARGQAAIACYASQTAAFGGSAGIAAAGRAYRAWWGGEPLWHGSRAGS
jgi:LmbE family N-acetylglucosaminyl deacetylase